MCGREYPLFLVVVDGTWVQEGEAILGSGGHLILKRIFTDYIFEVTAEHLNGPKETGWGVGTRATVFRGGTKRFRAGTSDIQGYAFNLTFNRRFNLFNGVGGSWYLINPDWKEWQHSEILNPNEDRVRIEALGNQITIFVNDRKLASFYNDLHRQGSPFLWVQEPSHLVKFTRIRVTPR